MQLKRVEIEGYRSITKRLTLHVEPNVTIILGANDHGKSNVMHALLHLNPSHAFQEDQDLSWDLAERKDEFPHLLFEVSLDADERKALLDAARTAMRHAGGTGASGNDSQDQGIGAESDEREDEEEEEEEQEEGDDEAKEGDGEESKANTDPIGPTEAELTLDNIPSTLVLERRGVRNRLIARPVARIRQSELNRFLSMNLPRVELIVPGDKLSDSVTHEEVSANKNEFMRGIFYYAGLDPNAAAGLFAQNDATERTLETASTTLNRTLKQSWSQGSKLSFILNHNSSATAIELKVTDPDVKYRRVRVSKRSSGFTHYFGLKTVLYARQRDHEAKSYIWLFDEPGVFLHPSGQFDLLQVLETLGKSSQILYVTHSLFMINKSFPGRHRLLRKEGDGTVLEGKPYQGRWGSVLNAFGLSLAGTILFANHVLLTEGDSDPIYIHAMLQALSGANRISMDLNPFAAVATTDWRHADSLIRLLVECSNRPRLAVLADGDPGGKARLKELEQLLTKESVTTIQLPDGTSIEDHLLGVEGTYLKAVEQYLVRIATQKGTTPAKIAEFPEKLRSAYTAKYGTGKVTAGVSTWVEEAAKDFLGLSAPSKVGIAREYALLLETADETTDAKAMARALALAGKIQKELAVPAIVDAPKVILEGS